MVIKTQLMSTPVYVFLYKLIDFFLNYSLYLILIEFLKILVDNSSHSLLSLKHFIRRITNKNKISQVCCSLWYVEYGIFKLYIY